MVQPLSKSYTTLEGMSDTHTEARDEEEVRLHIPQGYVDRVRNYSKRNANEDKRYRRKSELPANLKTRVDTWAGTREEDKTKKLSKTTRSSRMDVPVTLLNRVEMVYYTSYSQGKDFYHEYHPQRDRDDVDDDFRLELWKRSKISKLLEDPPCQYDFEEMEQKHLKSMGDNFSNAVRHATELARESNRANSGLKVNVEFSSSNFP